MKGPFEVFHSGRYAVWPKGWYWWSCSPGCIPDGCATGPFETEAAALADAEEYNNSPEEST